MSFLTKQTRHEKQNPKKKKEKKKLQLPMPALKQHRIFVPLLW